LVSAPSYPIQGEKRKMQDAMPEKWDKKVVGKAIFASEELTKHHDNKAERKEK